MKCKNCKYYDYEVLPSYTRIYNCTVTGWYLHYEPKDRTINTDMQEYYYYEEDGDIEPLLDCEHYKRVWWKFWV